MMKIDDVPYIFCCPDCRNDLVKSRNALQCDHCNRAFAIYDDICLDILPSTTSVRHCTSELEEKSFETYSRLFNEPFTWKANPIPWGLNVPDTYKYKLLKHRHKVHSCVPEAIGLLCDISTGSGRFSWEVTGRANASILCDLSVDSVVFLSKRVRQENKQNVLIVRCDYLRHPFKANVIDCLLCNDTLIYGYEHEQRLLKNINEVLKKEGVAILDFSNKFHRGFWHKPYTVGYSRNEMKKMLMRNGFLTHKCMPVYNELREDLNNDSVASRILKMLLPPTRFVCRAVK